MSARPTIVLGDQVAAARQHQLREIAPDHDVVPIAEGVRLDADGLARIEIAFFSSDLYPNGLRAFFGAVSRAPNLRWLHSSSAGIDNPIFAQIRSSGARLTTSSGSAAPAIARTVAMYLLALSRRLPEQMRNQAAHRWDRRSFDDVDGRLIGVVGLGPIGLAVVDLAHALAMRPIGMRRTVGGDEPCETWALQRFPELARCVDVLVLALPLTPETHGLLTRDVIESMKEGAIVINVGRGELIDESALVDGLTRGPLGGAGLDVFATEPLPADSPLWDLPNVIITPHNSGETAGTADAATDMFLDNLAAYIDGRKLRNEVIA